MYEITPVVKEIVFADSVRQHAWKFTKAMKKEFANNPAGRLWWVNTNTKIKTSVNDKCVESGLGLPPGMRVFAPIVGPKDLRGVIRELTRLYGEEARHRTLPHYCMAPYNDFNILFTSKNPEDRQMSFAEALDVLRERTHGTAMLVTAYAESIRNLLNISQETFEKDANLGIIRYSPGAGFQTHIDNIVRSNREEGPVFTMSLGGSGLKCVDMFPVIDHWDAPRRICTPVGSIILMDGVSRLQWSHGIPEGDPTERWTIMIKFRQITDNVAKYCDVLNMKVYESPLHLNLYQ
jgi:hypothetical protein